MLLIGGLLAGIRCLSHRQRLRMALSGHSRSSPTGQLLTPTLSLHTSPPDADQCRSEPIPQNASLREVPVLGGC